MQANKTYDVAASLPPRYTAHCTRWTTTAPLLGLHRPIPRTRVCGKGVQDMALKPTGTRAEPDETDSAPSWRDPVLWQARRASLFSAVRLVRLHLRVAWRLLLAVAFGILVAVTLIAAVPLYSDLVGNVQLQAVLNGEPPAARNVEVQVPGHAVTQALASEEDHLVSPLAGHQLAAFTRPDVTRYSSAEKMLLVGVGSASVPSQRAVAEPDIVIFSAFDYAQASPHMHLIAGTLPGSPQPGTDAYPEALITRQMATYKGVGLGDLLVTAEQAAPGSGPVPNDTQPGESGGPAHRLVVRVVGIWEPVVPNDPFWNGLQIDVNLVHVEVDYPVFLDQPAFLRAFTSLPDVETRQHWIYYTVPQRITTHNMGEVATSIGTLRTQLATALNSRHIVNGAVLTSLVQNVHDEEQQLALLALPLYVVAAQVVGLALLFVMAIAGLVVEGEAGQIATLESRGTSGAQLVGSFAVVGALCAVLAALAGPWLAGKLAVALIGAFVPATTLAEAGVTTAYLAQVAAPATAVGPAVAGALLGLGTVVLAVRRAARLDVLAFRREQGRYARRSVWRRYYVDVQVAVVCVLAFVDLGMFGGLGAREQVGSSTQSPVLLAAPGLLLLAGALALVRVFPYAVELGVRLAARMRGATALLAFAQVARNPVGPSRLTLLLALAVGLGLFGLVFDSSLSRNAADRASYTAGADLRLIQGSAEPGAMDQRLQSRLRALPGVQSLTPAYRDQLFTLPEEGASGVGLLAVDPTTWARVAGATSWRADYASESPTQLMNGLRTHEWGPVAADRAGETGAGTAQHPVWAIISQTFADKLRVRVGDRFALQVAASTTVPTLFEVGAIVQYFPTVYPTQAADGFIVVSLNDFMGAFTIGYGSPQAPIGPNEYWLQTSDDAGPRSALASALQQDAPLLDIASTVDRRALQATIGGNPLAAGVRGLLLVGSLAAAGLALLGCVVQSGLAARLRGIQFAVLRTLGLSTRELVRMLLGEQLVVYGFGLIGGTALGLVLVAAALPYLQFSDTTLDAAQIGVPPYTIAVSATGVALFYAVLVAAFVVALALAATYAARIGLGKALYLGDD